MHSISALRNNRKIACGLLILISLSGNLLASVTLPNTRVIYPGDAAATTLNLSNGPETPYIVQLWADIDNPQSTPETADAPFVIVPALFRIEPENGQAVRIVFTGKDLPQERESVFYLNMVQIPPRNASYAQENQMKLVLRSRIKLFYRPSGITGKADALAGQLEYTLLRGKSGWEIIARNPSAFYASLAQGSLMIGDTALPFNPGMLAPGESARWPVTNTANKPLPAAANVKFTLINDYGGQTQANTPAQIK